jgi:TPP-dependent pyruvate/acetoin dehydrogenase alpha subunit
MQPRKRWREHVEGRGRALSKASHTDGKAITKATRRATAIEKDPILRFRRWLATEAGIDEEQLSVIDKLVRQEIEEAVTFAEQSPEPTVHSLYTNIYDEPEIPHNA